MEPNIFRKVTDKDKPFIDVDLNRPKNKKTSHEKFQEELVKHEQAATKKGLPFARHAAVDDFKQGIERQISAQLKKYGKVEHPEKLKVPEIDWAKYSDLKNFELVNTKERPDTNLTNKNPGLSVRMITKTYEFKGWGNKYIVMESGPDAIQRAVKERAKLDKAISKDLDKPEDTPNTQ